MTNRIRLAAAAVSLLALAACNEAVTKTETRPQGRPVLVEKVSYAPVTPERTFVASIRPRHESDLAFRVGGKVAQRQVDVGQRVNVGDVIATLDDADLRLQREQAEAEMKAARAAIAQAQAEMRRVTDLRARGWSTESIADRQRAALEEAQGRVSRAERSLSLAENTLDYSTLRATHAGIVTATTIEAGQVVAAGQAAVRVARMAEREALIAVPEALIDRVRDGDARVSLWSAPDKIYRASLRELSPAADSATRTYAARFSIPGAGDEVQWGMTATVTIADKAGERAARLPLSAIANEGAGPSLYVVDRSSGALTRKPVSVLRFNEREALVTGGVNEGEFVVAVGVQKLDPAQKVRVVEALAF
ncbi:MAG: efflux RND transporter periplasmic adaptor subunit [Beijerinckiaceae bacterium]